MKEIHRIEIPRLPYPVLCLLLLFCAGMDKTHAGETLAPSPAAKSAEPFPIGCRQVYAGTVGGSAVEMLLGRNRRETGACFEFEDETRTSEPADGKINLTGYYYYLKTGRTDPESGRRVFEQLALMGQLDDEGNLELTESVVGQDTPTGRYRGSASSTGELNGTWRDAEGKRSLPFSLRKLDRAAQDGAVAYCIACQENPETKECTDNVIVRMPGEISLEFRLPRLQDALEYGPGVDIDQYQVSIWLLPGNPDLYQVSAFADQQCSVWHPQYGTADFFFVQGEPNKPVLTFSGGSWSDGVSHQSDDSFQFNYQGAELNVWGKSVFTCGSGHCRDFSLHDLYPVTISDIVGDGTLQRRSFTLQRYRIESKAAVPLGEPLLQKETVLTVGQGEQHSVSFVDDGTGGWLELSAEYPFGVDSPPPRPERWCWLYAHGRPSGKPSPWHPAMPREALQQVVAIAPFDPAEVEFVSTETGDHDETKNSAVAIWLNGRLLGFVVGAEQTCYSHGVRKAGPWGQPLDQKALNLYRQLFPPPFPETHRIRFAPGHSSATIHGVAEGGSAALYGLRARKGQTLAVTADAEVRVRTIAGQDVRDDDPDPTRVVTRLPRGGDYVIQATPAAGKTEFKLTVEIR